MRRPLRRVGHAVGVAQLVGRVAAAGGGLQAGPLEDGDVAAGIADQPAVLQRGGRPGDADAAHAQHLGQEFVSDMKTVRVGAILGHQEPAGQSRLHHVKTGAARGLRQLGHHRMDVAFEHVLQLGAALECLAKQLGFHAQGRARPLHQGALGRYRHVEHQRGADDALVAHQPHFQAGPVIHQRHQHDGAAGREIHMADGLARFGENLGELQVHRFALVEQLQEFGLRQRGEQVIATGGRGGNRHGALLMAGFPGEGLSQDRFPAGWRRAGGVSGR
jgi:hypothetical protein